MSPSRKLPARIWRTLFTTALFLQATLVAAQTTNPEFEKLLSRDGLHIEGVPILAEQTILDIYRQNGFQPIWNRSNVEELLRLLGTAEEHGLVPTDYNVTELQVLLTRWLQDRSDAARARAEILLTESLLRYGYHRRLGKVSASTLDPDINFRREAFNGQSASETVMQALAAPTLDGFIERIAPSGPYYPQLQDWLSNHISIQDSGGWPLVPDGPTLRAGDRDPRVSTLRQRLRKSGDLQAGGVPSSNRFDTELEQAVVRFQRRHALDADGIVGRQTIATLNVPLEQRIDQIRASLERLRWVRQEDADALVLVNIAGFRAAYMEQGEMVWTTRAMVGKHYRQTPVFRGDIAYMEFNPTWTIPPGILRNDTLPAIKKDPGYLASKNIRVIDRDGKTVDPASVDWNRYTRSVPYTLRQDPGPNNALGTVKFIFPNKHFVFLHDTPSRDLFDRPERAFSSGCIRIEDPLRLAELLLGDPARYNRSALQAIVDGRDTQRISLAPKVPVVIVYLTAGLTLDGQVTFYRDIYNRDSRVIDALNGPVVIDAPAVNAP